MRVEPKFIADDMVGRLARWLRIAGFDTYYANRIPDGELIARALREGRMILTRDASLSRRRVLPAHLLLSSGALSDQLRQVFGAVGARPARARIFTRCGDCNLLLEPVKKESVRDLVPPYVFGHRKRFFRCPSCGRIFWKGTHWERVAKRLEDVASQLAAAKFTRPRAGHDSTQKKWNK